jgi:hypothetical protein
MSNSIFWPGLHVVVIVAPVLKQPRSMRWFRRMNFERTWMAKGASSLGI